MAATPATRHVTCLCDTWSARNATREMAEPRQLANPPITEAVIDIRAGFSASRSIDDLASIAGRLAGYTETSRQHFSFSVIPGTGGMPLNLPPGLQAVGAAASTPPAGPAATAAAAAPQMAPMIQFGVSYISQNRLEVIQSRRDGLTFSRLRPYLDWGPLFDGAWEAWLAYRDCVRPDRILRVSTRFLNRIEIPAGRDLDEYFVISPKMPERAPNFLLGYSSALSIPFPDLGVQATVRLTMNASSVDNRTVQPLILDLDILFPCDFGPTDDTAIRRSISALRPIKNDLFFGSLTETAMELFQ